MAAAALLLAACKVTTQLPVSRELLELQLKPDELVCHVRTISEGQNLDFHYGTSQQSFGTMATFRLIGDGIEITLVNDQRQSEYDLRAYDEGASQSQTEKAFAAFKAALMKQPENHCLRSAGTV